MDQVRDQPLPRAGLPEDKDRGIHGAHLQGLSQDLEHRRAFSDHPPGLDLKVLHFQDLKAELVLDRLLLLELSLERLDLGDVPLVHHHTDQVSPFIEDGTSGDHELLPRNLLKKVNHGTGAQNFEGGGPIEQSLAQEVPHVSPHHLISPDPVQPFRRGVDAQDIGVPVADPEPLGGEVDDRVLLPRQFLERTHPPGGQLQFRPVDEDAEHPLKHIPHHDRIHLCQVGELPSLHENPPPGNAITRGLPGVGPEFGNRLREACPRMGAELLLRHPIGKEDYSFRVHGEDPVPGSVEQGAVEAGPCHRISPFVFISIHVNTFPGHIMLRPLEEEFVSKIMH